MLNLTRNKLVPMVFATGLLAVSLVSCVDDKYDLDDLDKTVRVKVDNLTLPLNLDPIDLDYMITLDDDSQVKEIDGIYAVVVDGDFDSDDVSVDPVTVVPGDVTPINTALLAPPNIIGLTEFPYLLDKDELSNISYTNQNDVSSSIISIDRIGVDWKISLQVTASDHNGTVKNFRLDNFKVQLPKGLTGTPEFAPEYRSKIDLSQGTMDWNPETGVLTLNNVKIYTTYFVLDMPVSSIDCKKAGVNLNPTDHTINYNDCVGALKGGEIVLTDLEVSYLPDEISLKIQPVLSDIVIKTFTGEFEYQIENFNIEAVSLSDLPDVLSQDDTNIVLANPQIYLSVNNPFSEYGIKAQTGMVMTPYRDGKADLEHAASPNAGKITIGTNGPAGTYDMVLAPDPAAAIAHPYGDYKNLNGVEFTSLATLLSGKGLPSSIAIDMVDPCIPATKVTDYRLGSLSPVHGHYTFYAPLQFGDGTRVVYTGEETDLGEDLEKMTVRTLKLATSITSNLPIGLTLNAWLLDKNGNELPDVTVEKISVPAECKDHAIELVVSYSGSDPNKGITGIDGIRYEAVANADANSPALSPKQSITLKDIKITVSGWYEDEL